MRGRSTGQLPATASTSSGTAAAGRGSTAHAPRVSSPLATLSTTASYSSDEDDVDGSDSSESESESESEAGLDGLLVAAKERARQREQAAALADADAAARGSLEDVDFASLDDDSRLPAVFTKPAVASQVFAAGSSSKARQAAPISPTASSAKAEGDIKGKGRLAYADRNDDDEDEEILPGVRSKWGEMPRGKVTPKEKKASRTKTAGKGWFDMPRRAATSLTGEEKREIQALRLSNAIDPKRFMRGEAKRDNKKLPEFFQMGYVVESGQGPRAGLAAPSSKIKKASFLSGILENDKGRAWAQRKYAEVQEKAQSGGRGFAKKRAGNKNFGGKGGKKKKAKF